MNTILELLMSPYQFWLVLGVLLLPVELLTAYGCLLAIALSAFATSLLTKVADLDALEQCGLFLLFSIVTLNIWYLRQRKIIVDAYSEKNRVLSIVPEPQQSRIDDTHQYISLATVENGYWKNSCPQDLPKPHN